MTDTTTAAQRPESASETGSSDGATTQPPASSIVPRAADVREGAEAASIAEILGKAVTETSKMVDRAAEVSRSGALPAFVAVLGFLVCIFAPLTGMVVAIRDTDPRLELGTADFWVTDNVVIAGFAVGGVLILGGGVLALLGAVLPAKWISVAAAHTADTVTKAISYEQLVAQHEAERQAANAITEVGTPQPNGSGTNA